VSQIQDAAARGGQDDAIPEPERRPPLMRNEAQPAPQLNKVVFYGSAATILALAIWAMAAPDQAEAAIGSVVGWISSGFGWYYFLVATVIVVFVVWVGLSRFGRIKLGPEHSRPQFNVFTWAAMLFAAGIGIDLMFFSVSEPVTQYLAPPTGEGSSLEGARQAVVWTLFHYGITGWAMYALMGMALGYFTYRRNMPLSLRSALFPVFGKKVWGRLGDSIDIAAILGTIFGLATSLGIGVVQLNYGLNFMFDVPQNPWVQATLILVAVVMATVSVLTGVERGIRRLSELSVLLAAALMVFVLVNGRTGFLLNGLVMNIGDYVGRFVDMTMDTFAYQAPADWLNAWTLFFWAWWIAWAPFVGLFLARISRGRSIREFITATMIIPFIFILLFISIFGNSALDIVLNGGAAGAAFGEAAMTQPEQAFYALLAEYPAVTFSAGIATVTGLLFYVTSADSGALVMAKFSSKPLHADTDGAKPVRVFWAVATGVLTLAMLLVGGITTLQNATIIMGLPFSVVMLLTMLGLFKAFRTEGFRMDSVRAYLPGASAAASGSAQNHQRPWRQRLSRVMSYPDQSAVQQCLDEVCAPALQEVAEELRNQGADAVCTASPSDTEGLQQLELTVRFGNTANFIYRLQPTRDRLPAFVPRANDSDGGYYRIEVHLDSGGQGYCLAGCSKDQVIGDVLDHYERHLHFLRLQDESQYGPVTA
jgi:choline/glycine/proline betaine transport protein